MRFPQNLLTQWQRWRNSLPHLENVSVPRCYHPTGFGKTVRREIHAFSDASKDAIGASIYLRLFNDQGKICTALLFGQSKVAPTQTTSIPRLELCTAVLASQAVHKIKKEMTWKLTRSRSTRTQKSSSVTSKMRAEGSMSTSLTVYKQSGRCPTPGSGSISIQARTPSPKGGKSRRIKLANRTELLKRSKRNSGRRRGRNPTVSLKTQTSERRSLGADRFSRFSSLHSLQRAIANLIVVVKEFKRRRNKDKRKIASAVSRVKNTH